MNTQKAALIALITMTILGLHSSSAKGEDRTIPLDTKFYPASGEAKDIAILFLGGSGGGVAKYYDYEFYTRAGYSCLAVGYFKTPNTSEELVEIPLEYLEHAIDLFQEHPHLKGKKIVVLGASKGGELALLLGATFPQINGVIACVPSNVVFQGIGDGAFNPSKSSWTYHGQELPFVPFVYFDFSEVQGIGFGELYASSLKQSDAVKKALIKVENTNGPILLLSGKDDTVWPSSKMCDDVVERLKQNNFKFKYQHIAYEDAGHTIHEKDGQKMVMGGSFAGNQRAIEDVKKQVLKFLREMNL